MAVFSIFCCLREIGRVRLQTDLEMEMNLKEDQAMPIDLGADEDKAREAAEAIGQARLDPPASGMVVI